MLNTRKTSGYRLNMRRWGAARPIQRGISTVELLVGVTVGLFIVGAALFFSVSLTRENRQLLVEARLMQDVRSAMDIVTRELRRAGYWANSYKGAWYYGATAINTPYASTGYATVAQTTGTPNDQISYAYSRDTNDVSDATDQFGFRVIDYVLQMNVGDGNFQPLTDPGVTRVTQFKVTPTNPAKQTLTLPCPKACPTGSTTCPPTLQVREFEVLIEAQATGAGLDTITRTLRSNVRLRNDISTGSCPP
jgi:type IV pilus assembly protein PilW